MPMDDVPDDPADPLYDVRPDAFTAERNAQVKALKKEGRKDAAAVVSALRRPTPTAWALNQVARGATSHLVADALAAGRRLATGAPDDLRDLIAVEGEAIDAVVGHAVAHLDAAGLNADEDARIRMAQSLRAAAFDDDLAAAVVAGHLHTDHEASGFSWGAMLAPRREPGPAVPDGAGSRRVPDRATRGRVAPPPRAAELAPASPATPASRAPSGSRPRPTPSAYALRDAREKRERELRRARLVAEATKLERRATRLDAEATAAEKQRDDARRRAEDARRAADDAALAARTAREAADAAPRG